MPASLTAATTGLLSMADAAAKLDMAAGTLRGAVDRGQLPAPEARVGRRRYYDAAAFAAVAEAVATARGHGFFPRLSDRDKGAE